MLVWINIMLRVSCWIFHSWIIVSRKILFFSLIAPDKLCSKYEPFEIVKFSMTCIDIFLHDCLNSTRMLTVYWLRYYQYTSSPLINLKWSLKSATWAELIYLKKYLKKTVYVVVTAHLVDVLTNQKRPI